MKISIGDKVKASKEYGGKSGVVTDIRGSFITVEYSNGDSDTYHESDLTIKSKKMETGGGIPKWEKKSENYVVGGEGYSEHHDYYTYKNAKIYYNKVEKEWLLEIDNKIIKGFKTLSSAKRRAEMMLLDNYKKGGKMENGGVIGQEIVFDDNGEVNTGVIKDIHENTGNYIVTSDDGRTLLADKELDVISLGKMRAKPEAKKRFSFFEDGGNVEKETKEMLVSQIKEVKHHADELSKVVNKNTTIEPWVLAKATRAKTDLSDITHYLDGRKMVRGGNLDSKSLFDLEYGDVFSIDRNPERPHTMTDEYFMFIGFSEKYAKTEGVSIEAAYFPGSYYGPKYDEYKEHAYLTGLKNGDITIISKERAGIMLLDYQIQNKRFARGGKLNDAQQAKFNKVLHEWKADKLHSGSKNGPIVTDQDQALAIAYAEANSMMAFGGMINDDLSEDSIDRMEGLSPTATLDEFIMNTQYIVQSLEEEGFEKDEILSFLAHVMVININEANSESNKNITYGDQNQFDSEYWLDYNDETGPKYLSEKLTDFDSAFSKGVKEWDSMNEDGETLSQNNIERSRKVAKQFFDKEGYITISIIMAMISQESFSNGGKMAKGGMTEHGLREGDKIIFDHLVDDNIDIIDRNGSKYIVDLDKGKRYKDSGEIDDLKGMRMLYKIPRNTQVTNAYEKFKEYMLNLNKGKSKYSNIMPYINMNGVVILSLIHI